MKPLNQKTRIERALESLVAPSQLGRAVSRVLKIVSKKKISPAEKFYGWEPIIKAAKAKDHKAFAELLPALLRDPDKRRVWRVLKICGKELQ
jgi:hypothetical protein